jgi:hypothetical protein
MINEYLTYFLGNKIAVMKNKCLNKYSISVVVFLVGPKEQMVMIIVL